jgi:hypothetical protein
VFYVAADSSQGPTHPVHPAPPPPFMWPVLLIQEGQEIIEVVLEVDVRGMLS